jgi:HK97 family phage major capsid protein
MSQEFIEDAIGTGGIGTGLQYVADRIGLSLGLKTEDAFTVGTGSSQPQGICLTAAVTAGPTASNLAALTGDNIIDTVHTVGAQYRSSPKFSWLMSDGFLKTVRKLKVNTTDYIWKPGGDSGLVGGAPATIYGVPYKIGAYVPATGVAAVVGDFQYFEIFDRSGMTSLMDPYTAAANNQTTLYSYIRTDSHSMLPAAFASCIVTA